MLKFKVVATAAAAALAFAAAPASATELFFGAYAHDVTFLGKAFGVGAAGREDGADLMLGIRSDRLDSLSFIWKPQAHAMVSVNTDGTSHFAAAGLSWPITLSGPVYFRPGIGLAYTTGRVNLPPANAPGLSPAELQRRLNLYNTRIDFGSKVLFEPELAIGVRLNERVSLEASWVHLSNGRILGNSKKNQGMDDAGVRLGWKF